MVRPARPHRHRRRPQEDGLLRADGGVLLVVKGGDRIGFVSWSKAIITRAGHCWEIGLIPAPEFRGRGYGTQAHKPLVRYLFDHSTVHRIQAGTEITNVAEQRALEKAGFTREGVLRGAGFRAGKWHDGVRYSFLRSDLPDPERP
ncbi:GNAT family N-acetyltransferase [Planobispora rosea]|uniref:GNAT family N-acetyltransferase n=1 Tax=Planobispora rosea TaxID=35762 RepID=UPI001942D909|nr:GNAT family protein [Planobispora rosea]